MGLTTRASRLPALRLPMAPWWCLASVCLLFGGYAIALAIGELGFLLGVAPEPKYRAHPVVFVVHAIAGATALLAGPMQFHPALRRRRRLHRAVGYGYVTGVLVAGVAAVVDATSFNVPWTGRLLFVLVSVAWMGTTALALAHIRAGHQALHRAWMARSLALTLFFVSGAFWMPLMQATSLPAPVGYPLALFLSAAGNLALAQWWIRRP